jgi:peptidoglycan-associated lipoprotein
MTMKLDKIANRLALGLLLTFAVSGCKHTTPGMTNVDRGGHKITDPATTPGLPISADGQPKVSDSDFGHPLNPRDAHKGWLEDASIFKAYTAHFAFDSSAITPADKPNLDAVAAELKSNPAWAVRIEGNCDERGTEEYNRSLGERRALALRESLISLGIDPTRVDTISYGEDKPVATGHDESAWKQNRRGDFIQLTPPK